MKKNLARCYLAALRTIVAIWSKTLNRISKIFVIRSSGTTSGGNATTVSSQIDSYTSSCRVPATGLIDGELHTTLDRTDWRHITVFDDSDDEEDDEEDDTGSKSTTPSSTALYDYIMSPDQASSNCDSNHIKTSGMSSSGRSTATTKSLKILHKDEKLNDLATRRMDIKTLEAGDIPTRLSLTDVGHNSSRTDQAECDGVHENQENLDEANTSVQTATACRRLPRCNWRICDRVKSARRPDAPSLIITNPDGIIEGYLEESWVYCRSELPCLCSRGWYCHLYDEAEDWRIQKSGAELPRCTWDLYRERKPVSSDSGPGIVVTTPEGETFYPWDE